MMADLYERGQWLCLLALPEQALLPESGIVFGYLYNFNEILTSVLWGY